MLLGVGGGGDEDGSPVLSLSLTEGAQPALGVQAAVSSTCRRAPTPAGLFKCMVFASFSSFLIILLNLYSGHLHAFQK